MRDLDFISGRFFDYEVPKDLVWLKKYYDSDIQDALLKYYLVFGNLDLFTAHTGIYIDIKYLQRLRYRLDRLIALRRQAKLDMDLELLWKIESGRYKFSHLPSKYKKT